MSDQMAMAKPNPIYKKIRPNTTPAVVRSTSHLWGEEIMVATDPPRNVIYYNSNANQIPLAGIANLSYTDVIIGFLVPDGNLNLIGAGGAFDSNLQNNIMALQSAGKNVLILVGGSAGFPSSAWRSYAQNVNGLVTQLVGNWVTLYGFDGVDIDFEDDAGFTGTYDGVGFLSALTSGLAQALPAGQNIITHAPQTPYWDPSGDYHNAYTQIWKQVGNEITWINNQFYSNTDFDHTAALKVSWYRKISATTGSEKLLVGAPVARGATGEGYITSPT
jgi:chitinase